MCKFSTNKDGKKYVKLEGYSNPQYLYEIIGFISSKATYMKNWNGTTAMRAYVYCMLNRGGPDIYLGGNNEATHNGQCTLASVRVHG